MLTDTQARKIASEWHGGQFTALYALSSSGAIDHNQEALDPKASPILAEITDCKPEDDQSTGDLIGLLAYVIQNGPRGPVAGWSKLSW